MPHAWLAHRYGKSTFMGRWGAVLALLAAIPIFLLFCQGRRPFFYNEGSNPHVPTWMPPLSIACVALLVTVLAIVAVLRTLGGPRISLAEGWLLTLQTGIWTGVWMQSPVWDFRWNEPLYLRWSVMSACLGLGAYAAAACLHRLRTPARSEPLPPARWWSLWLLPHALHAALLGAAIVWMVAEEAHRAWLAGATLVAILYAVFRTGSAVQAPPVNPASEPPRSRAPIRPEARRRSVSAEPIRGDAASGRRRAGTASGATDPSG